jgi:transcriptional regulator with XRE-family HTH domain
MDKNLQELIKDIQTNTGLTLADIADRVGYSREHVTKLASKGQSEKLYNRLIHDFGDAGADPLRYFALLNRTLDASQKFYPITAQSSDYTAEVLNDMQRRLIYSEAAINVLVVEIAKLTATRDEEDIERITYNLLNQIRLEYEKIFKPFLKSVFNKDVTTKPSDDSEDPKIFVPKRHSNKSK